MKNERPHILFVCGRNKWRSPTAEKIYAKDHRVEVRSAGVSAKSRHQLTNNDIKWADLILVMETKHQSRILEIFRSLDLPLIESLDIPDEYKFMDEELIEMIRHSTEFLIKRRFGIK